MTGTDIAGAAPAGRPLLPWRRARPALVVAECVFIFGLLALWLASPSVRHSRSLWVLFFFSFPSQFVVAAVPHEPVILFFGKFYSAWAVALTATAGTVITEVINYSIFETLADLKSFQRMWQGRFVARLVALFRKAPFLTLWIAGLTPVPFYPFRFLVALARFPLPLYALAILLSRFPRFFVLALLGRAFNLPNGLIIGLFLIFLAAALVPVVRDRLRPAQGPDCAP
jgi:membrane protein YqaA with SNARE-associated domain